jgi:FkbM family methyltransferase
MDSNFIYPGGLESGAQEVLDGEYDIRELDLSRLGRPARALDIGGNCGAFSYWIRRRLTDPVITAWEPHRANIPLFRMNNPKVELRERAVVGRQIQKAMLYDGVDGGGAGSGQASLECRGGQRRDKTFMVDCEHASTLPSCDWMKLDTEGLELEILLAYGDKLDEVAAVTLEYHHRDDRFYIGSLLQQHGLRFVSEKVMRGGHSGVLRFARQAFLGTCKVCHRADGRRQGFLRTDGRFECQECQEVFQ